jgi:hypothetical protein
MVHYSQRIYAFTLHLQGILCGVAGMVTELEFGRERKLVSFA